jgi:hypothetical protein
MQDGLYAHLAALQFGAVESSDKKLMAPSVLVL